MQIAIEVFSWEKYNPRKDLKSMPWLRIDSDIGTSEKLYGLTHSVKWFWIVCLSLCARKISGKITIDQKYLMHHTDFSENDLLFALESLKNKGLISYDRITNESDRITNESVPNERTNERNERDETPPIGSRTETQVALDIVGSKKPRHKKIIDSQKNSDYDQPTTEISPHVAAAPDNVDAILKAWLCRATKSQIDFLFFSYDNKQIWSHIQDAFEWDLAQPKSKQKKAIGLFLKNWLQRSNCPPRVDEFEKFMSESLARLESQPIPEHMQKMIDHVSKRGLTC